MAHIDIRLPDGIAAGAMGYSSRWKTEVSMADSGEEVAVGRWPYPLYRGDIGYVLHYYQDKGQKAQSLADIIAFHMLMQGRLHSFRFKDHADFQITNAVIGVGDDTETVFQAAKTYQFRAEAPTLSRPVKMLVVGTVTVKVDGVTVIPSAINHDTGVITLPAPPTAGQLVTLSAEFDKKCKFDDDELGISHAAIDAGSVPSIGIHEVP